MRPPARPPTLEGRGDTSGLGTSSPSLAPAHPADPRGGPAHGREAQSHREGLTHFFELALLVQPVDVSQQGAPVCVLQLEDADQRLHEAGGALGKELDRTGLQLLQPWAALEAPDPASVEVSTGVAGPDAGGGLVLGQAQCGQHLAAQSQWVDAVGEQGMAGRGTGKGAEVGPACGSREAESPRPPWATSTGRRGPARCAWEPRAEAGTGWEGAGCGPRAGLTRAGPGHSCACKQRFSSQATQASREGPFPRQPRLLSSMSRRAASGSSRVANPLWASSRSCGDTRPRRGESSCWPPPPAQSRPHLPGPLHPGRAQGPSRPMVLQRLGLAPQARPWAELLCALTTRVARMGHGAGPSEMVTGQQGPASNRRRKKGKNPN